MKIPLLRAKVHENWPTNTIATSEILKIRNFIGEHFTTITNTFKLDNMQNEHSTRICKLARNTHGIGSGQQQCTQTCSGQPELLTVLAFGLPEDRVVHTKHGIVLISICTMLHNYTTVHCMIHTSILIYIITQRYTA